MISKNSHIFFKLTKKKRKTQTNKYNTQNKKKGRIIHTYTACYCCIPRIEKFKTK